MPTTSVSGWGFHNFGPLTTTYTAPTSCFTETPRNIQLATNFQDENNSTSLIIVAGTCATTTAVVTVGDCLPSGPEIDKFYATYDTNNPFAGRTINYFSPGLACPSGYATVGVATKADSGSITSSGAAFVPTSSFSPSGSWSPTFENPVPNVMLQGLNKGETAILCCPSSYTAELQGYCWSALPSYTATVGCARILPSEDLNFTKEAISIFGTTITANLITYVATSPITETTTETRTNPSEWIGVGVAPALTLIHNAADATSAASQPTKSSAASLRRAVRENGSGFALSWWVAGLVMGILCLSLI